MYDLKIQEYSLPLLKPNLEIDSMYIGSYYLSDTFLPEETYHKPNTPVLVVPEAQKQNSSDSDEPTRIDASQVKLI